MPQTLRVRNQKIGKLDPVYIPSITGDFDVKKYMSKVYQPIFRKPMVPTTPVDISIDSKSLTDDDIWELMLSCCTDTINPDNEALIKNLLHQTLADYDLNTSCLFKEMFTVAAATEANLPEPNSMIIYTPAADVIPAASKFIQGTISYEEFFASFAYYFRLEALGVYFVNETAFDDFKIWFQQEINVLQGHLDTNCLQLVSDFMQVKLDGLTESFKIRNDTTDNIHEFSFARVLISLLMKYFKTTSLAGIMPFDTEELFCPKNIVLLNVTRFAHSSPYAIKSELNDIKDAINITNKLKMISNNKLTKLAPITRAMRKTATMAVTSANSKNSITARAARTPIRNRIMTKAEYFTVIKKILKRMNTEMRTMNIYRLSKSSFKKPNRRNPDDFNLPGIITSTKFLPNIHIYLDTSGSVTESNYEAGLKLCIQLAKQLNVNLYINSFSHVLSQTWMVKCENKTLKQIYEKFQKIPKVTGGTDYAQIWEFINKSKKRQQELSILITDFEFYAPSRFIQHPQNLYYMPFANINWDYMKSYIEQFMNSAKHNDPLIRNKILA